MVIVMVYSVGYPIGHTALLGLFSKIMKSGRTFNGQHYIDKYVGMDLFSFLVNKYIIMNRKDNL